MRVLVTGGAGFIGANLVRLLAAGSHEVRVYDDFSTGDRANLRGVDAEILEGDVRDGRRLERALRGTDAVVHLAASGSVVDSVADPATNFDVNVAGTYQVLDTARRAGVGRVVQASTGGALFGRAVPPVDESCPPSPISPYGASKLAGEGYAQAFAASYGLATVVLRFGNVYGPWSAHKKGALTAFLLAIRDGRPMVIYGDGSASRDYVYVDDLTAAVRAALERDVPGGSIVHIATGRETTVSELAGICRTIAGSPRHPIEHRPARRGEVDRNFASYAAAAELLGFRPCVGLEEGIGRTWRWLQAHLAK